MRIRSLEVLLLGLPELQTFHPRGRPISESSFY